ncbi:type VII secretion protein EccB [Amycolatopsis bartoniae]|uniref:type VII secretion protein EccB n=1 Tax=Amycolatopsis bartoniae TaxID=941986 RepID=UPI0011963182|nr:type VII secretion protein EccB [Amycolatopsis bartoniae]MBB2933877.1 type VII secretion protein EccB [Amycolatopsis bartoniae]TVT00551.1 type VII secretion protein EccB [Amycolatopsis bartoniae]
MPSTPTTKSQVQAYRFVLRRMQSALVRRDSVMLHDPMRTHSRATLVGFILGLLGVVGFVIFGLISPSPAVPDSGIVIGKDSGTIYVVSGNPKSLTPTFNLASARLLLLAQSKGAATEAAQPTVVPDDSLKDIPHNRRTGIVDGPQLLPSASQRISDAWGVCDNLVINDRLPDSVQLEQAKLETTVYAGVSDLGKELALDSAVYAKADNGKSYLIYRLPNNPNDPNADTVRAEVDPNQAAVSSVFGLNGAPVRHISIGLLNAIPEVTPLAPPTVPSLGGQANFPSLAGEGLRNGNVFRVNSVTGASDIYVILPGGIQKVEPAVGDLIRASQSSSRDIPVVSPNEINGIRQVQPADPDALPVSTMPAVVPTILDPAKFPTTCLGWTIVDNQPHTVVTVGSQLPTPQNAKVIDIGKPGPDGKIDHFYLPPGRAAVVQSATSADSFGKGPMSLVTDNGLRYGIPDANTLKGLGLDNPAPRPAPETILRLLPSGTSLNVTDAQRSFDDIPVDGSAGTFPTQQSQAAVAGSGQSGSGN